MKNLLRKVLKVVKKIIIPLIIILILAGGFFYWQKYTAEKKRKLAEEEKRKQEELQKEKQRQLLEQKKKEYLALIEEMKKYFKEGNYKKVKELSKKALALAKEYNFDTSEINKILHQIEVAKYLEKLKQLKEANKNIFNYFYVRKEVLKIPLWKELRNLRRKVYETTFQNEYLVILAMAERSAGEGKEGKTSTLNYYSSKYYLYKAKNLRIRKSLEADIEREKEIAKTEKDTFFAWRKLRENTIPSSLYR